MIEGTRRAVIVGINQYQDPKIPALMGAENDARELYERLRNPNIGSFQIADNHFLLGEKATAEGIRKAISDVFWQTDDPCELALFYFSGHGLIYGGDDSYFAPWDFSKDEPFICGASIPEFKRVFSRSTASSVIVILDCCYSGVATQGDKAIPNSKSEYESTLKALSGEGRFILTSSSPDQKSREISLPHFNEEKPHAHGAFSFHMIEGLDGHASEDEGGIISLPMLQKYVEGKFSSNPDQRPRFYGEGSNLGTIQIAIATEKYNRNIAAKIESAKAHLEQSEFAALLQSVKDVHSLLEVNGKHKEGLVLKTTCETTLNDYKNKMQHWLTENVAELKAKLPVVYDELDGLVDSLDFSVMAKLDHRNGILITTLSRAVTLTITKEQFVAKCKPYDNPKSRPQSISRSAAAG